MVDRSSRDEIRRRIIAICYRSQNTAELFRGASTQLRQAVDFDADHWLVTDPDSLLPIALVSDHFPLASSVRVAENELLEDDFNKLGILSKGPVHVGILGQQTGGKPELSARYRNIMVPSGWAHEMRAALVSDSRCWGYLCMHRGPDKPDFSPDDARFIARVGRHLAEGIRRTLLLPAEPVPGTLRVPSLLILDGQMIVETMTPEAESILGEFEEFSRFPDTRLPEVIYTVATRARALSRVQGPASGGLARARIRTHSGRWLVVHGSTLAGRDEPHGRTAIVIESAHPAEVMPFLLESYDLSPRERQVMLCVMKGFSTDEVAKELNISTHTVQEHLKAIFRKTGVRSRRELVGQVFFDRYFPQLEPRTLT